MIKYKRMLKKINGLVSGNLLNLILLPVAIIIALLKQANKLSDKVETIVKKSI